MDYGSTYPKEITEAIAKVMGADLYVQKRGKNAFHGYKYATVGDLLDKLQPLMAEAGLVIFQHELETHFLENGSVMTVRYQFTLAHTSGAVWPERPIHTGMAGCRNTKGGFDDKAANKCHTAARKYFLLGLFQVPTGEDFRQPAHDGDADGQADAPPPHPEQAQDTAAPPQTRGATRSARPAAVPPARNGNGLNKAALPPTAVETPDITEARQRIRGLIDQLDELIRLAPHKEALELTLDDHRETFDEIEAAGEKGIQAAAILRGKAQRRLEQFEAQAA